MTSPHRGARVGAAAIAGLAAVLLLLYLVSRSNFLLFHAIVELSAVVVGFAIFILAWNTRRWASNEYLLFLGIAFASAAAIDVVHTLAYSGMGVFPEFGPDEPTQLWILARSIQALSLLASPLFLTRRFRPAGMLALFAVVTVAGLLAITRFGVFPQCYVAGEGLTTFKVVAEYVIAALLAGTIFFLYRRRRLLDSSVFRLLVAAMLAAIAAEMAFTLYVDVYGFANMVGHLFKVASFVLIFHAVVVTGLSAPHELLFRDVALSRDRAQAYLDAAGTILLAFDRDGVVQLINRRGAEVLGYAADEIVGHNWFEEFLPESRRPVSRELTRRLFSGDIAGGEYGEGPVLTRDGGERLIAWHNTVLRDAGGAIVSALCSGEDITERRAAESRLIESERRFRVLFQQAPDANYLHDFGGRFVDVNAATEKISGYARDELVGRSVLELGLFSAETEAVIAEALTLNLRGEPAGPNEYTLFRKDGSTVVIEVRSEPIYSEGVPALVLGTARDITERRRVDERIRLERDRFMALFNNAPEGVVVLDAEARIADANEKFLDMFGYPRDELIGRTLEDVIIPEGQQEQARDIARMMKAGQTVASFEAPRRRRDGSLFDALITGAPILSGGENLGAFLIYRDVTERKRAEDAVRASEDKFRSLFEQSIDAIYVNPFDGRSIEANQAWLDLFGFTREDLQSIDLARDIYIDPREREDFLRRIEKTDALTDERRMKRKDGTLIDCLRTVVARRDEQGRIVSFQGVVRDVTSRNRQEEALRKSEEQYRLLFENSHDAICLFSPDGRVVSANRAAVALFGYEREEFVGMHASTLYADPSVRPVLVARLLDGEGLRNHLMQVRRKDGSVADCEVTGTVLRGPDGAMLSYQILLRDVTERLRAEAELLRNDARLRSIVSILQHETGTAGELLDHALDEAVALTDSKLGYIYLYDEDRREFTVTSWSREVMKECTVRQPSLIYPLEKTGIWGEVVRQRRPIVVNDFAAPNPLRKGYPPGHVQLRRFATMPVLSGGRIVAVVGVANKGTDYTDTDMLQLALLMDSVWRMVERIRTEEKERQSARRLEQAMSAARLAWWQMKLPSGMMTFDERIATMLGHVASGLSHYEDFVMLLHPDDIEDVRRAMRDHLEGRTEQYQVEHRVRTPSGAYRWSRDVASITERDADGNPTLVTGIVVDITDIREAQERLAQSVAELRDLAARLNVAREEERAAIAWELHDEVAQALAVMKMDISSCAGHLPEEVQSNVTSSIDRTLELLDATISRLRKLYTDLVPVMLEDLGLAATMEWQAEQSKEQAGVEVRIGRVEELQLSNERVTLGLFRVLQEALDHMASDHGAASVTVDFVREDGHAVLRMSDDGCGPVCRESSHACAQVLTSIRERARSWGGNVEISSEPSQGTTLSVTAPLRQE